MSKTISKRSRIFCFILTVVFAAAFIVGYFPKTSANAAETIGLSLKWNNGSDENITVETGGTANKAEVKPVIYIHGNNTYVENALRIVIPRKIELGRDGRTANIDSKFVSNLKSQAGYLDADTSNEDNYVIYNKEAVTAPNITIEPKYELDAIYAADGKTFDYSVSFSAEDNMSNKTTDSKTITGNVNTRVDQLTIDKKKVNSIDGGKIPGKVTSSGQMFFWNEKAAEYYGYTEERFSSDIQSNYIVEYRTQITINGNQPYYLSVKDTPVNGEVIGVYAEGNKSVSGIMTKEGDVFKLYKDGKETVCYYAGTSSQPKMDYVYALVKYPKSGGSSVSNAIDVTALGIDGKDQAVKAHAEANSDRVTADAEYRGNIWGIKKYGINENINGALNILENGGDKEISFWIRPAEAYTYQYGQYNSQTKTFEAPNGPYKVEVIDDALYLSSGVNGQTLRMSDGDYEFDRITVELDDKKVNGIDASGMPELVNRESSERPPVEIYAKTSVDGSWKLVRTLTDVSSNKYYYIDENRNRVYQIPLPENTVQVKVSYGNSENGIFGSTVIYAQVFGKLKGSGNNVKRIVESAGNLDSIDITNWACIQGFDKNDNWLNVCSESNIVNTTNVIKNDLLDFEVTNYEGHNRTDRVSQRAAGAQSLKRTTLYTGAADGVTKSVNNSTGVVNLSYNLAASMNANARLSSDAAALAEIGTVHKCTKAVFYDLLPEGVEYSGYDTAVSMEINDPRMKKTADCEGTVNWGFPDSGFDYASAQFNTVHSTAEFGSYWPKSTYEISETVKPRVTAEVTNNYKNTGRQMVRLTLEYDKPPIGCIGTGYKIYGELYAVKLKAVSTSKRLDSSSESVSFDNLFAAQFIDENGKPYDLSNYTNASVNDGAYYGEYASIFAGLGNTGANAKNVVYAPSHFSHSLTVHSADIEKKVKAHGYDNAYKISSKTLCGKDYSYRLSYINGAATAANDIVIFDTIENNFGDNDHWQGKLKGFDVTEADAAIKRIYPNYGGIKIYVNENVITDSRYKEGMTSDNVKNGDNGWKPLTGDTNYSKVRSVAFVVGKEVEFNSSALRYVDVYVNMQAPDNVKTDGLKAYNNMAYYSVSGGNSSTNVGTAVDISLAKTETKLPSVEKKISGDVPKDKAKEFKFSIKPVSYTDESGNKDEEQAMPMPAKDTITVKGEGSAEFGSIAFVKAGIYKYEISEVKGNDAGYTYSDGKYTVEITVTDNNAELSSSVKTTFNAEDADNVVFTNTYKPNEVKYTFPTVTKNVNGNVPEGQEKNFTFVLSGDENAPMPEADEITVNGSGSADFGSVTYSEIGEYNYTITEKQENEKGYIYDRAVFGLKLTVYDNDGQLAVKTVITKDNKASDDVSFTNNYSAASVSFDFPSVEKTVEGSVPEGEEKTFTFAVTADKGVPMPENGEASVVGSGKTGFGKVNYTEAGTYTYKVTEENGGEEGYTYDSSEYTVVVTVIDDNSVLKASCEIIKDKNTVDNIEFVNKYDKTDSDSVAGGTTSDSSSDIDSSDDNSGNNDDSDPESRDDTVSDSDGGENPNTGLKAVSGIMLTAVIAAFCIKRRDKNSD